MMRTVAVNAIPEPDSHETPYFMPDNVSVARAEQADVEYLCEECSAALAELPFMTALFPLFWGKYTCSCVDWRNGGPTTN